MEANLIAPIKTEDFVPEHGHHYTDKWTISHICCRSVVLICFWLSTFLLFYKSLFVFALLMFLRNFTMPFIFLFFLFRSIPFPFVFQFIELWLVSFLFTNFCILKTFSPNYFKMSYWCHSYTKCILFFRFGRLMKESTSQVLLFILLDGLWILKHMEDHSCTTLMIDR